MTGAALSADNSGFVEAHHVLAFTTADSRKIRLPPLSFSRSGQLRLSATRAGAGDRCGSDEGAGGGAADTFKAPELANTLGAYATMGHRRKPGAGMTRVLEGRTEAMAIMLNA